MLLILPLSHTYLSPTTSAPFSAPRGESVVLLRRVKMAPRALREGDAVVMLAVPADTLFTLTLGFNDACPPRIGAVQPRLSAFSPLNPSGTGQAAFLAVRSGAVAVGFEDVPGGGDYDFDDAVVAVSVLSGAVVVELAAVRRVVLVPARCPTVDLVTQPPLPPTGTGGQSVAVPSS